MVRSRSAEQAARLLLSNAVRHDTWECKASTNGVDGLLHTLKFSWNELPPNLLLHDTLTLHMTCYNKALSLFVGTTYTVLPSTMTEPLIFRSRTEDLLLVVELVVRDERAAASHENRRVLFWGYVDMTRLCEETTVALRPGSAQLLLLDAKTWPRADHELYSLTYNCTAVEDPVLTNLMMQLVPPNVFVPQSFAESDPQLSSVNLFSCVVRKIKVYPTIEADSKFWDDSAEWSVAAVAHNGYQQLGHGAEVPLVLDDGSDSSTLPPTQKSTTAVNSISTTASSKPTRFVDRVKETRSSSLHSLVPLKIDGLPVHSSTSLVLAIRRRRAEQKQFEVLGFSVFPLCVMPVENRDLRVENLPALHGPFSCRDPRMLMLESSSPYGKLPLEITLTVEYYETNAQYRKTTVPTDGWRRGKKKTSTKSTNFSGNESQHLNEPRGVTQAGSSPFVKSAEQMGIISTADGADDAMMTPHLAQETADVSSAPFIIEPRKPTVTASNAEKHSVGDHSSVDIFKLLCNVMEEMRRLRELQEMMLRHGRSQAVCSEAAKYGDKRLDDADAVEDIGVVDLSPSPVAISWETRRKMVEDLQPIMHPFDGTPLEDCALTKGGETTASLYGIRFEGLTADISINIPDNICFMFSFGTLPLQTLGPVNTVCIDKNLHLQTFKLFDENQRGGMVWSEPPEAVMDSFVQRSHQRTEATVYIHVYNALTMFYLCSANISIAHFRRPYNAESAQIPIDSLLYRDLTLTERHVPEKVFPILRNAGQLHITLFCVAGNKEALAEPTAKIVEPSKGSRVIVAKKLPHADLIKQTLADGASAGADTACFPPVLSSVADASGGVALEENSKNMAAHSRDLQQEPGDMHWRRVQHVKKLYAGGTVLPGVPDEHHKSTCEADLEFRLRYLEKQRDELKSQKIGETLIERLTVQHHVHLFLCCAETTRTVFQNPFTVEMKFGVEVDSAAVGALEIVSPQFFCLAPRGQTEVVLVARINNVKFLHENKPQLLRARIFTERRGLLRIIDVYATVGPRLVDRRFEIFGPPGTEVSKKFFLRTFSSALFPIACDSSKLLSRMRDMCAFITITSETTKAETNAVCDPITQTKVIAWEEITVHTSIPSDYKRQRIEYLALYKDSSMSKVFEVWELCIFACRAVTSRELFFGQTTTVALPAAGVEAMYCSDAHVRVVQEGNSYLLHVRPQEVGVQQMLLHTLTDNHLVKTLLSVPTVYPTPTYTQMIELCLADATAPIFRRLHFVHSGDLDEIFTVHHNYSHQLRVTPKSFALAPGDSQFITLQIDMLILPAGQVEGRWPMWIFINNANDKTVESYLLQVVLRAHRVLYDMT